MCAHVTSISSQKKKEEKDNYYKTEIVEYTVYIKTNTDVLVLLKYIRIRILII